MSADPGGLTLLDLTLGSPAADLALDEALLERAEALLAAGATARDGEVLRFWESPTYFVALGVSSRIADDVDLDACRCEGVPVLRRASGGGTVLQGPGSLNYALVLALDPRPALRDLTRSYREVLARVAAAIGVDGIALEGTSDIAVAGRKVSGNAQKRTRRALLHHGTLLHGFDLDRVARLLKEPEKQPDYRQRRGHGAFVANLPLPASAIKAALARAWGAATPAAPWETPDLTRLVRDKYGNPEWTSRF